MTEKEDLRSVKNLLMPAALIPSWNCKVSRAEGKDKNILIQTWGGLGDQVCAEPVLRYALEHFKGREFSLATHCPELFNHLNFKDVFDLKRERPLYENYHVLQTIYPTEHLIFDFIAHPMTHCVDHISLSLFRMQLPIQSKNVVLKTYTVNSEIKEKFTTVDRPVVVHAGKHWPSKTFPKDFWERVVATLKIEGFTPVLIGRQGDLLNSGNVGVVDVNGEGCLDLRDKTSLNDLIWLLQNTKCLITNDSSPIHIAASGQAHIGFIASCKHPDFITHYRKNLEGVVEFGWRMKNLGHDGLWNYVDAFPIQDQRIDCDILPEGVMGKLLPTPREVLEFVKEAWA